MLARPLSPVLLVAAAFAVIVLCLPALWPVSARLDFLWLDKLTAQQAQRDRADRDIVLIDIDDYSLRAMADTIGRWPWPRATHADPGAWPAHRKHRRASPVRAGELQRGRAPVLPCS